MKLNVWERLKLVDFLPEKGSFEKAIIASDIKKKIQITQAEIVEYEIKTKSYGTNSTMSWNEKGSEPKEFVFTELEISMLKDEFSKIDKEGKILVEESYLNLCKKIKEEESSKSEK